MHIKKICLCGLFSAILAICAWLSLPVGNMMFTLQTFGVFLALSLLGGKWGTVSILVYLLLGLVGLPVFSGFRGGPGMLFGATGGFLLGFLAAGGVYWAVERCTGQTLFAMIVGCLTCYAFGAGWYYFLYLEAGGLWAVLCSCIFPYLLPDAAKIALAWFLSRRLKRIRIMESFLA